MSVDDGGVEGIVSEVNTDLTQRDAFLEQMRGIAVAQGVCGRTGVDTTGGARHPISGLDTALTHGSGAVVHGLAESKSTVGPAAPRRGKKETRVLMRPPPLTQLLHHLRSQWDVTVLATLAIFDMEAGRVFASVDVFEFDADGF